MPEKDEITGPQERIGTTTRRLPLKSRSLKLVQILAPIPHDQIRRELQANIARAKQRIVAMKAARKAS